MEPPVAAPWTAPQRGGRSNRPVGNGLDYARQMLKTKHILFEKTTSLC
jgi:hypothetical protein